VPPGRRYDVVIVISRSGTTTEVLDATATLAPHTRVLAITAVDDSPLARLVADRIVLSFADERSIVQTRFATSTLSLLLASCGWDVGASATRAEEFLDEPSEDVGVADHFVFLGRGVGAGPSPIPRWSIATVRSPPPVSDHSYGSSMTPS
jgi:fructoselysine-6-P-deglycase FrlB-like protein